MSGSPAPPRRRRTIRQIRGVHVIACGASDRGDDGVAEAAVAMLPDDVRDLARIHVAREIAVDDLLAVPPGDACIVLDAAVGPPPGGLVVMPLHAVAARAVAQAVAPRSSHELPLDQVLRLVEILRGSLPEGTFMGVGGLRFGFGRGLSAPVRAGLPALVDALIGEIRRLATTTALAATPGTTVGITTEQSMQRQADEAVGSRAAAAGVGGQRD